MIKPAFRGWYSCRVESKMTLEKKTEGTEDKQVETKPYDWREEPGARAQVKQITELQSKLEAIEKADADRRRAEEESKIKTEADLKAYRAKVDAELASEKARAAAEIRHAKAEALSASVQDPWKRKGLLAELDALPADSDLSASFEQIKKEHPSLFENAPFQMSGNTPQGARSSQSDGSENWDKIVRDTQSSDWKVSGPAFGKISEYHAQNGKYPPGYTPKQR